MKGIGRHDWAASRWSGFGGLRGGRFLPVFGFVAGMLCGCAGAPEPGPESARLSGTTRPRPEIPGAPAKSDVCMRSLFPRPLRESDPHDTLEAMRRFHVTWLEWTYGDNAEFIRKVKDMGATFGGALAAGSYVGDMPHEEWNVRDREGNLVYAPWMRAWARPNPWGCANHPEFREGHVRAALRAVEAGADLLQRDEPGQNRNALSWGCCFCQFCMNGFNEWLARHADPEILAGLGVRDLDTFDYREYLREKGSPAVFNAWFNRFQIESSVEFDRWWREELNRRAGRRVTVSCNNDGRLWSAIQEVYDYCIGELSAAQANPEHLYSNLKTAHAFGKTQTVTMPLKGHDAVTPEWIRLIRQTLATVYAIGAHMEMPWDTYLPTPDARRFFGDPADYADLTAFVRGMARFLDGYSDAFAAGGRITDDRWPAGREPVLLPAGADRVYAFARAVPGDPGAPAVVHLIDWRAEPEPFRLTLDPQAFFGGRPLRFRFFTPVRPYDPEAHDRAFETGDYSGLVRETEWPGGYRAHLEIPALAPWGILVVEPAEEDPGGVWPSAVHLRHEAGEETARLVMRAPSPGARIHYTLDGSDPTPSSDLYREPLEVSETVTVTARAFVRGRPSEPAQWRAVRADSNTYLSPDAPPLRENLRLWLSARSLAGRVADGEPLPRWEARAGPAAETPSAALFDGTTPQPPVFSQDALDGHPAVQFDGGSALLAIEGFAGRELAGGGMTVLMLSRSTSPGFGLSGNGLNGQGGIPRLYMTRQRFHYGPYQPAATVGPAGPVSIIGFQHDGAETVRVFVDGQKTDELAGLPVVPQFGAGGHLAMPYWAVNAPQAGGLSEVLAYNRALTEEDVRAVSLYLARQYELDWASEWRLEE